MDIIIQSLGFKHSANLEVSIREKLEGLKSDDIVRANVTLYKGSAGNPESDYCEIRLEVPGNDHFVKKNAAQFETAFHECVEVLTQKIKKTKEKHVDGRQADAAFIQDKMQEDIDITNGDVELEDVVR